MPTRRRALRLGAVGLAGALAGCASGALDDESGEDTATDTTAVTTEATTTEVTTGDRTSVETTSVTSTESTTEPVTVETSLPEGTVEFNDGPKSPPERPDDLTPERVREYVATYERRHVYNGLYYDETSEVHQECEVETVTEYGVGFRVVVRCSAYSNTGGENETTLHADYFTQYATYFVGPDSTVRIDGKSEERE